MPKKINPDMDLQDSEDDKKHLQPEKATLDLPDVEDIPGQENIKVPRMKDFADVTASSADEEGDDLFDNDPDPSELEDDED